MIPDTFKFSPVSWGDVEKEIMNLDNKSSSRKSIPATTLDGSAHIYLSFLTNSSHHSLHENTLPAT